MNFTRDIIKWYDQNKRDLPFRNSKDPYVIWVSEIILQQTRVNQGLSYYNSFIKRFPDIFELSSAGEQEVLKLWQGMGYYNRARNMLQTAREIVAAHKGHFPGTLEELLKLKGIGPYTANAIASLAFNIPVPAIDGNVQRVIARIFGLESPIESAYTRNKTLEILQGLIDPSHPGLFNQAMIEFGALYCRPKNPDCQHCIFRNNCIAYKTDRVNFLPVKKKMPPLADRYFNYLVILSKEGQSWNVVLNQRRKDDIWRNLYDFPMIETKRSLTSTGLRRSVQWRKMSGLTGATIILETTVLRYALSHQRLMARFIVLESDNFDATSFLKVPVTAIHEYPVPRPVEKFLEEYWQKIFFTRPGILSNFPD